MREKHPDVRIFHEDRPDRPDGTEVWRPGTPHILQCLRMLTSFVDVGPDAEAIDLVITLGGDGTILHASSLFKVGAVPPVLSFSMGTLGFLLPFRAYFICP